MLNVKIIETDSIVQALTNIELDLSINDKVIVESQRGIELGILISTLDEKESGKFKPKPILRKATLEDINKNDNNNKDANTLVIKANKIVDEYKLDMKIINANYTLDRKQLLFIFIADQRIDFRDLAKELGIKFKTRIELKQIGIRDKAKCLGGLGVCGRTLCCSKKTSCMDSVSINMAKNQSLALNPNKINGACGRLMCCLKYEDDIYTEMKKNMPKIGERVKTSEGDGRVIAIFPCRNVYKVDLGDNKIIEVENTKDGNSK